MSTKDKPVRKRKPPTELRISEESRAAMQARLESEEGQQCLDELAKIIAEWAAKSMPSELLGSLDTAEGQKVVAELWPDIVNAFFKAHTSFAPRARSCQAE